MTGPHIAVYSAIYGTYEATAKPLPPDLPCPAYVFTDQGFKFRQQAHDVGWTAIYAPEVYHRFEVNPANGDPAITRPMLAHKWWKTHPIEALAIAHTGDLGPEVDISIWLDGNMQVKGSGVAFVDRCLVALGDDEWSAMRHPFRSCIYAEAEYTATVCAYRYDAAAIRRQIAAYDGFPREWGLAATGHMVRRHTPLVRAVGEAWWQENVTWSHQDQISLPFVLAHAQGGAGDYLGTSLRFNYNVPWGELWELHPHGR